MRKDSLCCSTSASNALVCNIKKLKEARTKGMLKKSRVFLVDERQWLDIIQDVLKGDDLHMVAQTWLEAASYANATDAQAAVRELRQAGFEERDISVIYTDAGHTIRAGMISGAVWGGVLGAL